jgi:mono/diheme cytochrome c family protein
MKTTLLIAAACTVVPAAAQTFPPEQIKTGAEVFATNCVPCHGERMADPTLFNLREFPKDQRSRFINSVSNGKNAMPPWRGQLKPDDIEALWSYVAAGEKNP